MTGGFYDAKRIIGPEGEGGGKPGEKRNVGRLSEGSVQKLPHKVAWPSEDTAYPAPPAESLYRLSNRGGWTTERPRGEKR